MNNLKQFLAEIEGRIEGTQKARHQFDLETGDDKQKWEWEEIIKYSVRIGAYKTILADAKRFLENGK